MMTKEFTVSVIEIIKKAGDLIDQNNVLVKYHRTINDLVTENDLISEKYIVGELNKLYPDVNIISEEKYSSSKLEGKTFVIDPIDGTCNFASNMPHFGVQLAYFEGNTCMFSVVYLPKYKELFYAILGEGCYLNGQRVFIDKEKAAKDSVLILSDAYSIYQNISLQTQFDLVMNLQSSFLKTRLFGAACVDFSTLVKNQATCYITYYYYLWDIAPGLLLASEAGAVYANLESDKFDYSNKGLVVANNQENLDLVLNTYKRIK